MQTEDSQTTRRDSFKKPVRRDSFAIARDSGLSDLAAKIGLSASQLAENLLDELRTHAPEDFDIEPLVLAEGHVNR